MEKAKPDPLIKGNWTTQQESSDPTDTMDEKAQGVTVFEEDRAVEQSMELRLKKINETLRQIEAGTYKKGNIPDLWDGHATERIFEVLSKL